MATYKADGIIIKSKNFSETDKILTLFTKRQGKINVLAKGARRITSRKGPHLDLFNKNTFFLAEGKNFDIITEVKPLKAFLVAKETLGGVSILYYLGELVDKFVGEGQPNLKLFCLLEESLDYLSTKNTAKAPILLRRFELHFISELGFKPELYYCVGCRNSIREGRNTFSAAQGGLICPRCAKDGLPISPEGIKVLRFLSREPQDKAKRLSLKATIDGEIKNILRYYIEWILERKLKSQEFMEEVRIS